MPVKVPPVPTNSQNDVDVPAGLSPKLHGGGVLVSVRVAGKMKLVGAECVALCCRA